MSAASSIRLFLGTTAIVLVLLVIGAVLAQQWLAGRKKEQEWQEQLRQAQIYALLGTQGQHPKAAPCQFQDNRQLQQAQLPPDSGGWKVLQ